MSAELRGISGQVGTCSSSQSLSSNFDFLEMLCQNLLGDYQLHVESAEFISREAGVLVVGCRTD